ncbi:MAG: 2-dehydropantoate 2-reductase, partial [Bacteroidetes bacterium]|nr:2-dehydropantoate 2-reductase [Bacteroidota bacterium]
MKTRIGILGLGGVGGYFGGLLAKAYKDSETVEIVFIARGKTLEIVSKSGLKLITDEAETIV